jgi:hypothetical protein
MSPPANYTARATAACRGSKCQLLRIEGCRAVSAADSLWPYSWLSRPGPYFFFQVATQLYTLGWVDPFQTHYFSENVVAPGIQPRPLVIKPQTLTARPQKGSLSTLFYPNTLKFSILILYSAKCQIWQEGSLGLWRRYMVLVPRERLLNLLGPTM